MSTIEKGKRYFNPNADAIIGEKRVMPRGGFVALHNYMGGDGTILQLSGAENMLMWGDTKPALHKMETLVRAKPQFFKEVVIAFRIGVQPHSELEAVMIKEGVRFSQRQEENEYLWTTSLNGLIHFIPGRLESGSQVVRDFAIEVADIIKVIAPLFYQAFEKQMLGTVTFTRTEQAALLEIMLRGRFIDRTMIDSGLKGSASSDGSNGVIETDFLAKLGRLLRVRFHPNKIAYLRDLESALAQHRNDRHITESDKR